MNGQLRVRRTAAGNILVERVVAQVLRIPQRLLSAQLSECRINAIGLDDRARARRTDEQQNAGGAEHFALQRADRASHGQGPSTDVVFRPARVRFLTVRRATLSLSASPAWTRALLNR